MSAELRKEALAGSILFVQLHEADPKACRKALKALPPDQLVDVIASLSKHLITPSTPRQARTIAVGPTAGGASPAKPATTTPRSTRPASPKVAPQVATQAETASAPEDTAVPPAAAVAIAAAPKKAAAAAKASAPAKTASEARAALDLTAASSTAPPKVVVVEAATPQPAGAGATSHVCGRERECV